MKILVGIAKITAEGVAGSTNRYNVCALFALEFLRPSPLFAIKYFRSVVHALRSQVRTGVCKNFVGRFAGKRASTIQKFNGIYRVDENSENRTSAVENCIHLCVHVYCVSVGIDGTRYARSQQCPFRIRGS